MWVRGQRKKGRRFDEAAAFFGVLINWKLFISTT